MLSFSFSFVFRCFLLLSFQGVKVYISLFMYVFSIVGLPAFSVALRIFFLVCFAFKPNDTY